MYDLNALSLQGVKEVSFREEEGWLWHTKMSINTVDNTELSCEQHGG